MNDEYENQEEQSSLDSISETLRKRKSLPNYVHRTHNPKIGKTGLSKTNTLNKNNLNKPTELTDSSNEKDDPMDFSSIGDIKTSNTISGAYNATKFFFKNKWLLISVCGGGFFFLILIIAVVFLLQNADTLNYASGNFYANEEYQRLYQEVGTIANEYQSQYGVKIDKYLILSILTSYQDNANYKDDTESGIFDVLQEYGNRSKMSVMIETLAKYQVKTITSCNKDSSSTRQIASNDESTNITNFWTSEISREKNYDCSGDSSDIKYEISIEQGKIDDDNSGSVFFWNLIDEDFFKEYYPEYFSNLSKEDYEKKAAETLDYIYLYTETLKKYDKTAAVVTECNGSAFWWPIGSDVTSISSGKTIASGEPSSSTILANFANSGGLEITSSSNNVNVIAAKGGVVIYPNDNSQISYPNENGNMDGDGYGNYVIIEHSDGTYTLYGHLWPNSITVMAGEQVTQGQVIGKMGSSGNANTRKLRFEVRVGGQSISNRENPEDYVSINKPRSGCSEFSLTTTSLSKQEFVALMNWYCISTAREGFCNNFAANSELIYDVSLQNNVNPELVVVTAGTEQNWNKCDGLYNFWGIGISNGQGCSDGPNLTSMEDGIKSYAQTINRYLEGGSYADLITNRYNQRLNAGCDPSGYGLPGTLSGMQSVYSWIGNYRYDPGNWGLGGCVYLNEIYGAGYCDRVSTCTNQNNCPASSKTTVCEQSDYTAWQLQGKVEMRQRIFGL